MDPTVLVALVGAVSTVGSVLITGAIGRRQRAADAMNITVTAHASIYEQYGTLIGALRTDMQLAREEARGAHSAARAAEQRADTAEDRAYTADYRMRAMERLLVDLRPLIVAHIPGANAWIGQVDRYIAAGAHADNPLRA